MLLDGKIRIMTKGIAWLEDGEHEAFEMDGWYLVEFDYGYKSIEKDDKGVTELGGQQDTP
jgi:hypothetical protein